MLESQHHMIFYPEDRTKLDACTKRRACTTEKRSLPTAILIPHASYSMACEALHRSFEQARDLKPSTVVFLGPLHQEVLAEHEPAFLFTPQSESIAIASHIHHFDITLAADLNTRFAGHVMSEDSYFTEEPALELTLPFIQSYFPDVPVLALLCGNCDKERLATYAKVLEHCTNAQNNVLFIVSANANALLPATEAAKHAAAFIETLKQGSSLSEGLRMHTISSCNTAGLDAIGRQRWGRQGWNILGMFLRGREHASISAEPDENEKRVWHISAVLGAHHANQ